jgi:hypothetical protein
LLVAFPLAAGELKSPQAQRIAQQMSQMIEKKIQEITALEKAMGVDNVQIHLSQSQQYNSGRFGIILSANSPGLVISVTPNSQADRLGIHSGDLITSVNGDDITSADNIESSLSVLQYAEDETAVDIAINRHGKSIMITGVLTAKLTPGWIFSTTKVQAMDKPSMSLVAGNEIQQQKQACGQIKLRFRIENGQKTRALKTVVVVEAIDGIKVENPLEQRYLKIPVGYHKLKVHRRIHHFDDDRPESAEYLIRVDADTTYFIAYSSDTLLSSSYSKSYAELPVIWKAKQQQCEM